MVLLKAFATFPCTDTGSGEELRSVHCTEAVIRKLLAREYSRKIII